MPERRLESITAKFGRATYHYKAWIAAFDEWLEGGHYKVRGERHDPWFEVRLVAPDPPPELALIFSDLVTNLRACLDHIVWHLTTSNGRNPDDRDIAFPVVATLKDWKGAVGKNLKNFPDDWLDTVKATQPFQYGASYKRHPLYLIHHLDIRNRHRLLVPFVLTSFGIEPSFDCLETALRAIK